MPVWMLVLAGHTSRMASNGQASACEHAVGHPAREKINVDEEAVLVLLNVKVSAMG